MKYSTLVIFAMVAVLPLWVGCGGDKSTDPAPTGINWVSTAVAYDTLLERNDHTIIFFYTEWCGYCRLMDKETFGNATVQQIIGEEFNAVRINCEADSTVMYFGAAVTCGQMAGIYDVRGYPTTVFLSRQGGTLGYLRGYHTPDNFISALQYVSGMD